MELTVKKIRVRNFRCFKEAELDLPPITLLTGANSSGKTSLMYALLCTTQTAYPNPFPFAIAPNGEFCKLGGYRQIVFGQNVTNRISIGFDVETKDGTKPSITKIDSTFRFSRGYFQARLSDLSISSQDSSLDIHWQYSQKDYSMKFIQREVTREIKRDKQFDRLMDDFFLRVVNFIAPTEREAKKALSGIRKSWPTQVDKATEREISVESARNLFSFPVVYKYLSKNVYSQFLLEKIRNILTSMQSSIQFVGPARIYPERIFQDRSATFSRVGSLGENYVNILTNWKASRSPKFEEVMRMVRFLKVAENLKPTKLRDGLIQLQVKIGRKSPIASIQDVGFGVSQILPVLVADAGLQKGGTLLVSQPELHLHPSAQAALGNYFIQKFKSYDRKYMIETHSEYLLNRFRLLVAKGEISPDEIIIYHMNPQDGSFNPIPIRILKDGRLENAPKNYFDTYRTDVFHLAIEGE